MTSWEEAVVRIDRGGPTSLNLKRSRLPRFASVPVVMMGSAGAGKTRLWSVLTQREDLRAMSSTTDDGYLVRPNNRAAALRTVPGQASRPRYAAMDEIFDATSRLHGVVFVASFGFDHIWSRSRDVVGGNLDSISLPHLRARNIREELRSYQETCELLIRKSLESGRHASPEWVLVVVNKVDLFWGEIGAARDYSFDDPASEFRRETDALVARLGTLGPSVHFLPVCVETRDYEFQCRWGAIKEPTQLVPAQARASLLGLIETMEELTNG